MAKQQQKRREVEGEKTPTKRRAKAPTAKRATTKTKTKPAPNGVSSFRLKQEIKGIALIIFSILLFLSFIKYPMGVFGDWLRDGFTFLFGIMTICVIFGFLAWGWRLLYKGEGFAITRKGLLISGIVVTVTVLYVLLAVDEGTELLVENLRYGGAIGAVIVIVLRKLFGTLGAEVVDVALLGILALLLTRVSIGKGLHKAGGKVSKVSAKAKVKAEEHLAVAKENFVEWQEHRKQEREERHAYDQAKDPRYPVDRNTWKRENREEFAEENTDTSLMGARAEALSEDVATPMDTLLTEAGQMHTEGMLSEKTRAGDIVETVVEDVTNVAEDREVVNSSLEITEDDMVDPKAFVDTFPMTEEVIEPVEQPEDLSESSLMDSPVLPQEHEESIAVPTLEATAGPISSKKAAQQAAQALTSPQLMHQLNPLEAYEGAAAETSAVSVSTEERPQPRRIEMPYRFPPLEILAKGKAAVGLDQEVSDKAALLESTLDSFGIKAKIINATKGPAVTRYELEPARGVKVSKIVNLTDDIALNLAAAGIRMEAPIPGKAAIGIEIPNKTVSSVNLRDVLECDDFLKAKGGIPVGLGKDIAGKAIITDLSKMPHLLVAGSTGSGKSVCINTLISSILFRRKPDEVKLILIDPKMVELSNYNGVPHLMTPVVTDMKKAASVLRWAVKEMESRYRTFADTNVRDVKRYNELHPDSHMPLVVIIIDELADLMMVSPVDVEDSICRLAQMARAAGIHLVLATQRPSVDVITGTIKANVPSRISFAVSSQIDSRTILDMAGAEKLLGKGDMLFNPIGASKPVRIQGAFISDDEVEELVDFIKNQGGAPTYDESILQVQEQAVTVGQEDVVEDELLYDAIAYVLEAGQASTSMLQRKMRIGFTRAGRLMDAMEQMKIVGPHVGSKPRELLMSPAQVEEEILSKR